MSNFVFKRGDTFNLNLQLVDMDDALQYPANDVRRAIDLTGYTFTSQVKTLDGTAVATFICAVLNQSTQKGWLNVKSAASTTKLLNLGDIGLLFRRKLIRTRRQYWESHRALQIPENVCVENAARN